MPSALSLTGAQRTDSSSASKKIIRRASFRASCSSAMFALGALVACLVAHVFTCSVNAVSLVSLAAEASCGCGVFGCVGFFVGVLVFACLVWFPN